MMDPAAEDARWTQLVMLQMPQGELSVRANQGGDRHGFFMQEPHRLVASEMHGDIDVWPLPEHRLLVIGGTLGGPDARDVERVEVLLGSGGSYFASVSSSAWIAAPTDVPAVESFTIRFSDSSGRTVDEYLLDPAAHADVDATFGYAPLDDDDPGPR